MIKQIPLDGGLITQIDGEEVGLNACTELINAEFDKPGIIYKRKGTGAEIECIDSRVFSHIIRWYNPKITGSTPGYYWIAIDKTADDIWYSQDLANWTEITFGITNDTEDSKVVNYNTQLRFPCGLTDDARIYQYIDRDFFWSAVEGTPAFYTDIARPRDIIKDHITNSTEVDVDHNWLKEGGSAHGNLMFTGTNTATTTYYYKYSLVYDGNQESPLSTCFGDTSAGANTIIPAVVLEFDTGSSLANWNKRITAVNIYRATSFDGVYYKVLSASTKSDDGNAIFVDDCYNTNRVYAVNGWGSVGATDFLFDNLGANPIQVNNLNGDGDSDIVVTVSTPAFLQTGERMFYHSTNTFPPADSTLDTDTFESGLEGWSGIIQSNRGDRSYAGSNVGQISIDNTTAYATKTYTGVSEADLAEFEIWIATNVGSITFPDSFAQYSLNEGASWTTIPKVGSPVTRSDGVNPDFSWQKYSVTKALIATDFRVRIGGTDSAGGGSYIIPIDQAVFKRHTNYIDNTWGGAYGVYVSTNLALGTKDSHRGFIYQGGAGGQEADYQGFILKNAKKAFQVSQENSFPLNGQGGADVRICQNYAWRKDGNKQKLFFLDQSVDGVTHPTGDTSLDVKYRHSKYINGRNYVADLRITDGTDTEDHENWVIFSELNQPDVLPITNYIQITDAQGGKIVGIESLLGDLVVFMENGVYRLSIPSANPSQWTLSEAEENIGCISEHTITAWESGLFFSSNDHIYFLDANFQATPVTSTIKDTYQSATTSAGRTFYDPKKNRLLCRFGASSSTIYSLDLSTFPEERWTKVTTGLGNMDLFTLNEDLVLYSYDEATRKIKPHSDAKTELTSFKRTTGWISQSNLDRSGVLRRLNLKYKSADDITAKCYIDGDATTVVKTITIPADTSGADWYKCKPNVRCRSYMIELSTPSSTNDVEIRRLEVEFE